MFIKICANTNLEDALLATELGADAVGFVFALSKRQVTPQQVAPITRALPASVSKVGVFTSTDAEMILEAASVAGLTAVQLHSTYDPAVVLRIASGSGGVLRILQVVDVPAGADLLELKQTLTAILRDEYVVAALLDASHGGASGGTGKTFDWTQTARMVREVQAETQGQVIVAGGLTPDNVAAAIDAFAPWGVDVASGVEASPGKKDPARLKAFIDSARDGAARNSAASNRTANSTR
jgi:phosphoribosylanthranilate isomerase